MLRMLENRVLRRRFGPKRDERTVEWRKLQKAELSELYSSPNIRVIKSRRMKWAGHVARMVESRGVYRILMGKPEGKRPLGRPRGRWEHVNPYPTAFPYGNGMVLHFYQQQESSTTKTVHKVINKGLKTYV